jgi:uncharacterized protein (DUF1697 family)
MTAGIPGEIYMKTYVSFLRGVNMTGHNSIKMADLCLFYKDLDFVDAETYIQSGNVIFSYQTDLPEHDLSLIIERAILKKFNYNVPVMIRTIEEMKKLIRVNPFLTEENFDPSKMAVMFLYEEPLNAQVQKVINIDYPPDKFKIVGSEIFIYCPNGFGKTRLYTNFFEKKMGVIGTARNWKTITTILNIAEMR